MARPGRAFVCASWHLTVVGEVMVYMEGGDPAACGTLSERLNTDETFEDKFAWKTKFCGTGGPFGAAAPRFPRASEGGSRFGLGHAGCAPCP